VATTMSSELEAGSSTDYDGSAGTLVDSNIWIDCINADSPWHEWAVEQLQTCVERGPLHINVLVLTELLAPKLNEPALNEMFDVYGTLRTDLPWSCATLAADAYRVYRQRGGAKTAPLPDFYIGAHAAVSNLTVLTRDAKPYRSYFRSLAVLAPQ
jgi:predicted nucleic acid-binding protein